MTSKAKGFALSLLVLTLSTPAVAGDLKAAPACKPGSTSAKCLLEAITTLQGQVTTLQGQVTTLQSDNTALQSQVTTLQKNNALLLGQFVSVDPNAENGLAGPNIIISGANVHIESGSGSTVDSTGLGNLVIGYDEDSLGASTINPNRTGSHNLVVGEDHEFTSSAGAVFGFSNFISTTGSTVTGGACNAAGTTAFPSSLGTPCNEADLTNSSVSGGTFNLASGVAASISGGLGNTSSGGATSVSGGEESTASGSHASVTGGNGNMATALDSSVSGGENNTSSGQAASILGGNGITVSTKDGHSP